MSRSGLHNAVQYRYTLFFDVRIKFCKDGELQIVHNNITYKDGRNQLNRFLAFADKAVDCYIRLILDICKAFAERNAEINAYKNYYRSAERVLDYGNTDSVPTLVYDRYLDAIASLDKYREDEP